MKELLKTIPIPVIILIAGFAIYHILFTPKIAYIDTSKLLVGFSEAAKVERELKTEDEKWKYQLKVIQDSLQITMDIMSKEYDKAAVTRKKELQDLLTIRNQQVNNFRSANIKQMDELKQKKMQSVLEKANLFITDYGKKRRYDIIFGTAVGGSLLFGNEARYDITNKIIEGLNERYK